MRRTTLVRLLVTSIVVAMASACGGGGGGEAGKPAPTLQAVTTSFSKSTIPLGTATQFKLAGQYSGDATPQFLNATWSSSDLNVATVDANGMVAGIKLGTAIITANAMGLSSVTTIRVTPAMSPNALVWSGSRYVAIGTSIGTSTDGADWTTIASPIYAFAGKVLTDAAFYAISWDGSQFVAVGRSVSPQLPCAPLVPCPPIVDYVAIFRSANAIDWTPATQSDLGGELTGGLNGVVSAAGKSVAVGDNGLVLSTTGNGSWTTQSSGSTKTLNAIAWSGSRYVAVGASGVVLTSPDGATWTTQASGTDATLNAITWAGSQFVVVGNSGAVLSSPDGVTWTRQISGTAQSLYGIAWTGSQLAAVGANGSILTSANATLWTPRVSGVSVPFKSIIWAGNRFLAGGERTVVASPDGVAWTKNI
jgi:hypothetical protein